MEIDLDRVFKHCSALDAALDAQRRPAVDPSEARQAFAADVVSACLACAGDCDHCQVRSRPEFLLLNEDACDIGAPLTTSNRNLRAARAVASSATAARSDAWARLRGAPPADQESARADYARASAEAVAATKDLETAEREYRQQLERFKPI